MLIMHAWSNFPSEKKKHLAPSRPFKKVEYFAKSCFERVLFREENLYHPGNFWSKSFNGKVDPEKKFAIYKLKIFVHWRVTNEWNVGRKANLIRENHHLSALKPRGAKCFLFFRLGPKLDQPCIIGILKINLCIQPTHLFWTFNRPFSLRN